LVTTLIIIDVLKVDAVQCAGMLGVLVIWLGLSLHI
jgi:hypothetical protein